MNEFWLIVFWLTADGADRESRTVIPYQTMEQCEKGAVSINKLTAGHRKIDTQCICVAPAKPRQSKESPSM